jgi:hypothetical protein
MTAPVCGRDMAGGLAVAVVMRPTLGGTYF